MKRTSDWLCLLLYTLSLAACTGGGDGYMRAKVNGRMQEFRVLPSAQLGGNDGRIEHVVFGAQSTHDQGEPAFSFELWNLGGNITTGRPYINDSIVLARYYYQRPRGTVIYHTHKETGVFRITFSQVDKARVVGTFAGPVSRAASEGGGLIQLTEGSFSIPVHP